MPHAPTKLLCLLAFITTSIPRITSAEKWGVGANLVSGHVCRETWRSGAAIQPSAWAYVEEVHTLVSAWSSVRLRHPRLDDLILDSRTGLPVGSWGWVGGTLHWDWSSPTIDNLDRHSFELGSVLTWFAPPYRPTIALSYDFIQREGLLMVVSIPYTIRLGWMPPATFLPELALRSGGGHGKLSIRYVSFSGLVERKVRWLTIIPIASVVPRGGLREWLIWGGVHLSVVR